MIKKNTDDRAKIKRRLGDLSFTLFAAIIIPASYCAYGLKGLATLAFAFFLPLYVLRLIVWSFWSRLRPFLNAKLNPRAWTVLTFCIWGGLAILILVLAPSTLLKTGKVSLPTWAQIAGLLIAAGGLMMALWAQWLLGLQTTILTTRIFDQEKEDDPKVIATGPFALVPHPIFVGEWLTMLGCFLLTEQISLLGLLVVALLTDAFAAKGEEKDLQARFGKEYQAYRSKFPSLFRKRND